MKSLFALALLAASSGFALTTKTQTCKVASKKGPYSTFTISYRVEDETLDDAKEIADVRFVFAKNVSANDAGTAKDVKLKVDRDGETIAMSFDYNDWASTHIELGSDDDGVSAFVSFNSDGPSIRSFYTCEAFPFVFLGH